MSLLKGIDRMRDILVENTERFARGLPANNALLWGARGMGKSSLVKAAHAGVNAALGAKAGLPSSWSRSTARGHRESLPDLMTVLRPRPWRFIVFCDDLSFDHDDTSYKSLKAALDGGVEGRPANVILYATSNRRHLMSRDMMENERSTAIESQARPSRRRSRCPTASACGSASTAAARDEFLAMVEGYVAHFGIPVDAAALRHDALEWATTRGSRSGTCRLAVRAGSRRTARRGAERQAIANREPM